MQLNKISIAFLASTLIVGCLGIAQADDTDIYLLPSNISRDDSPNVLVIFDNSASMDHGSVLTPATFESSTIYPGALGNEFNNTSVSAGDPADYVYWCTNDSPVTCSQFDENLSAASVAAQRVEVAAVYGTPAPGGGCESAMTSLAMGGGSTGIYIDSIVGWKENTNNGKGKWDDLQDLTATPDATNHLECQSDVPADPSAGADFANNGNSLNYTQRYTNNANKALDWSAFRTVTLYSANFLNYLTDPSATLSATPRMTVAKDAVKTMIDSVRNVRFGLMVFNKDDALESNTAGNHGGRVLMGIDTMDDARRTAMKGLVDQLSGHPDADNPFDPHCDPVDPLCTGTPEAEDANENETGANRSPLVETLWEGMQYLGSENIVFGDNQFPVDPDTANPPASPNFFDDEAVTIPAYNTPFNINCQQAFVIIVTDGEPQMDSAADGDIGGLSANPSDDGQDIESDDENNGLLDELAGYMFNNDLVDDAVQDGIQRARVYTVGIGVTDPAAITLLTETADQGHGLFVDATNINTAVSALQGAVNDVTASTSSFVAPTLSVNAFNKLFNRDEVYFALFKPDSTIRWNGNIKKFKLCNAQQDDDGTCDFGEVIDANDDPAIDPATGRIFDTAQDLWGSGPSGDEITAGGTGENIPLPADRNVYAFADDYANLTFPVNLTTFPVETDAANSPLYADIDPASSGDPTILGLAAAATQGEVDDLTNWMLSQDSYDENNDGDTTDQRWSFASPLHGQPVAVTYGFKAAIDADNDGELDPPEPVVKLFVGTNDGLIRMINDGTGAEEWAYIPREILADQNLLAQNGEISTSKYYGMDGTPSFWINDQNSNGIIEPNGDDGAVGGGDDEFVYMYIGMRRGGKRIYAFDVTPSGILTDDTTGQIAPKLLWAIDGDTDADYAGLGQTWSRIQVTSIRFRCNGQACDDGDASTDDSEARTVLIFGAGYDNNQDNTINDPAGTGPDSIGNGIYIVDPEDGSRILWISNTGSGADVELADMDFSIPSDLALVDGNVDGDDDRIYVGDTGGQLWRVDLGEQVDVNNAGGTAGARLADFACTDGTRPDCTGANGTDVQDRRKFFYPPDVTFVRDSVFTDPDADAHLYDLVTVATGDRADPTDKFTEADIVAPVEAVHNRIYAIRDFVPNDIVNANYPLCITGTPGSLSSCGGPITEGDLLDVTTTQNVTASALFQREGWFIGLQEGSPIATPAGNSTWIGEKSLASTLIFANILFATTFVPANDLTAQQTCSKDEGLGRVFALNLFNGEAALTDVFNAFEATTGFDPLTISVSDRAATIGGGIPSEVTIVIREGGVTGLVGISGGTASPPVNPSGVPQFDTFWQQTR